MGVNTQPVLSNFFTRLRANNGWAQTVANALPREEDKPAAVILPIPDDYHSIED